MEILRDHRRRQDQSRSTQRRQRSPSIIHRKPERTHKHPGTDGVHKTRSQTMARLLSVPCRICGKELIDPESVKDGIGPICAKKLQEVMDLKDENDLKINPEYYFLVPRPDDEEYKALEADIIKKGRATEKIIVNKNRVILDGHTRYEICIKNNCKYEIEERPFENDLQEMLFVIDANLLRRHLILFQVIELNLKKADLILKDKARQQLSEAGKKGMDIRYDKVSPNEETLDSIHVDEEIAKMSGAGTATVYRVRQILEEGKPEEIAEARSKKRMITKVFNKVKKRTNLEAAHKQGSPPMPEGVYDIIYADPPWRYDTEASQRGKADNHYATMTTEEIKNLEIPSNDNALLFMWVTNAHLLDGLQVIKKWGFDYVTNFVWVKDKIGLGWYARGQHELLLLCRKGKMIHPEDQNRFSTVIDAQRKEHSAKPHIVYEMIETMYPNRRYLELFSRDHRENWIMWGLEA